MARRRKKRGSLATYLFVFIAACTIIYVVSAVGGNLFQKTATIEAGDMGSRYSAEAVIVRDESITDVEGLTSVKYHANEGSYVMKGEKIVDIYASGYSKTDENRLLNIRSEIKSSVNTILSAEYNDAQLDRHDLQVLEFAREVGMLVNGSVTGNLLNLERQLSTALEQRQAYIKEQYYSKYPPLAELYDNETSQLKKIQSWTNTALADRDCIVSFYTDGYESMLNVADIEQITDVQVRSVLNGEAPTQTTAQRGRTAVYRQVNPTGWYLLLLTRDDTWTPTEGQSYSVKLGGFDDMIVDGLVTSYLRTSNGLLVRMSVSGDVRPVLNVRTVPAEVSEMYAAGLKVPLNAIRTQNGNSGVVLTDSGGVFVPVYVILQDHDYAVIESQIPGVLQAGQKIRVF